jgi:allantoinase
MAEGPARLVGLRRKGRIGVGYDADLCVFAPDEAFVVDPKRLHHKHPITPYDGRALLGVVHSAWLHGEELTGDQPRGGLLSRGGA